MPQRTAQQPTDRELLDRYDAARDAEAFAALVRRHIGFVRAAARRQTGESHLADDVTQAVFIVLARKAGSIRSDAALAGWLFAVTRHAAQNAMKMRARQQYHEFRAAAEQHECAPPTGPGDDLREVLDEAISRLPRLDRIGVLLHFLQDRSHEQVGAALGLSAGAARKRIARALEKMRAFLAGRGVTIGAAALAISLRAESSLAAPAIFVQSTINVAMLSSSSASAATSASMLIAKGVSHMFTLAKIKAAAVVTLAVAGLAAGAVPMISSARLFDSAAGVAVVNGTATASASAEGFTAQINDKTTVEFLGVSPYPGDDSSWFNIAGEPIDQPPIPESRGRIMSQPAPEHQVVLRLNTPGDIGVHVNVPHSVAVAAMRMRTRDGDEESMIVTTAFSLQGAAQSTDLQIRIADEAWQTVGTHERPEHDASVETKEFGTFRFGEMREDEGQATVDVDFEDESSKVKRPTRVVAVDAAGTEYPTIKTMVQSDGQSTTTTYAFNLPLAKVTKLVVQGRNFTKVVDVSNISLQAGHRTEPKITVKAAPG